MHIGGILHVFSPSTDHLPAGVCSRLSWHERPISGALSSVSSGELETRAGAVRHRKLMFFFSCSVFQLAVTGINSVHELVFHLCPS